MPVAVARARAPVDRFGRAVPRGRGQDAGLASLDAETQMLGIQIGAAMADAASRLPEPLREAFNLYAGAGLSLREMAAALGLTLCCTKTRVFRANARMRKYLQPVWSAVGAPVAPHRTLARRDVALGPDLG